METLIYVLIGIGILVYNAVKKAQENANRSQGGQNNTPKTNSSPGGSPHSVRNPQLPRPEQQNPVENQRPILFDLEIPGRKVLERTEIPRVLSSDERRVDKPTEMSKYINYDERTIAAKPKDLKEYSEENLVKEALLLGRAVPEHVHGNHHAAYHNYDEKQPKSISKTRRLVKNRRFTRNAFILKELMDKREF